MTVQRTISPTTARRLFITRQRLAGERLPATAQGILSLFEDLGCVQIDPIRAVERTQLLVLWSRLGSYDPAALGRLLWQERHLFEYWAHAASIVMTKDYPIFRVHMNHRRDAVQGRWARRRREWMAENRALRSYILEELTARGPLESRDFDDLSREAYRSPGWNDGQSVRQMLDYLWSEGQIMVSRRRGVTKLWDLSGRCLPEWTPTDSLEWPEVVAAATQRSLRALGVATSTHISQHFTRGHYPGLDDILGRLETSGQVVEVRIADDGHSWPGPWYVHAADLALVDALESGRWLPHTTLLSPFDNLICDRARTEQLFGYNYRVEIYVPAAKRRYGYYVMPILHGDRLIGRIDPKMDRKTRRLKVNAVYAEPDAPASLETGQAIAEAIEGLARFLGAEEIAYGDSIHDPWRPALK